MSEASAKVDPAEFTLLIVDDVEANRDLLARRFRKRGFKVEVASNGKAALELVASTSIDLLILDVMMPDISGIDVLEQLRRSHSAAELPVIMATARGDSEHVIEALDLGANDYVVKPIDFPVLHARVIAALRASSARRHPRPRELGPGTELAGRYRLRELIGEGGFGSVYRALHLGLDRPVAVKLLRGPQLTKDVLARFRREGMTACRVQHPNALAILDSGVTDDGLAFLVMELLEGHTLEQELNDREVSLRRCASVLAPICDALAAAHAAGIVHRDVKPSNIFLHQSPAGEVPKMLDFGIAKIVGEAAAQGITVEGWIVGTPVYMAPERFGKKAYDGSSDVYSVGVMLHTMITGALPFAAGSAQVSQEPMALAMMHTHDSPIPLREQRPEVPEELERLVLGALAKRPADRPTAAELAQGLRAVVGALSEADPLARGLPSHLAHDLIATEKAPIVTRDLAPTMKMRNDESEDDVS